VLLHHILETPLHGRAGIDLHLGQKPKLRGRYADDSLIYISHFVGTLYIHVSLSFLYFSCSYFFFPNTKRPKIFPLFLFVCLFSFLALICFTCYFQFDIWKVQKYFALFAIPLCSCFKIENPKIFVVLLWFCKVCCRVRTPVTPLELGIHFILFKPHKWKAIMMTYDNPRYGKRLVWTLFVFIFVHILIYVDMLSQFM
jgi:hypothetical protein